MKVQAESLVYHRGEGFFKFSGRLLFIPGAAAGFVNIARAAERRTEGSVPMIPSGLRYDGEKPCVAHIVFGNPIYQNNFATKREIVAFVERKVRCLSGNNAC